MSAIDYVVMGCFFAGLFGVSAWVSRRRASKEQFFLAGRRLSWPFIGFALIAVNVGARYVIGFAGGAYEGGIILGQYEVVSTLNLIVLAFLLLPLYRRSGIYTIPQLLRHRFGHSTHLIYSLIAIASIFLTVPAGTCMLSRTLSEVTGTNMWAYVAVIVPVCVLLTLWGGLTSVAYNDMIMGVVILVGGAIVTWKSLSHEAVGGLTGLAEKIHKIDPVLLEGFRQGGFIPWQAVFTGVFIVGLWFWCIDQTRMQIVLAARTLNEGRRGALFVALLKYLTAFLVLVPGMCGRLIYPKLKTPDAVYGKLLEELLDPGLLGLVVAGLAAAVISTLMSLLNAAASIFTNDVVKRLVRPATFDRRAVTFSRVFIALSAFVVVGGVAVYARYGTAMKVILKVYGLVAGPTLAVYLLGIFWPRANARGANPALIVGLLFSFAAEMLPGEAIAAHVPWLGGAILAVHAINPHYRCVLSFALSTGVLVSVSLLTEAPRTRQLVRTTFAWYRRRRRKLEALAATPDGHVGPPCRDRWYLDYRLWSAILLVLLLATWWYFGLPNIWRGF